MKTPKGPGPKKATPKTTPLEDFAAPQWDELLDVEQALVTRATHTDVGSSAFIDLANHGFVDLKDTGSDHEITLTDRGWEVAGLLRRWLAERRSLTDFVVAVCTSCSRVRYGAREGVCLCGGDGK